MQRRIQIRQLLPGLEVSGIRLGDFDKLLLQPLTERGRLRHRYGLLCRRHQLFVIDLRNAGVIRHPGQGRLSSQGLELRRVGQHLAQAFAIGAALQVGIQMTQGGFKRLPLPCGHPGIIDQDFPGLFCGCRQSGFIEISQRDTRQVSALGGVLSGTALPGTICIAERAKRTARDRAH